MKCSCPKCEFEFDVPENLSGSKAKCSKCGTVFVIEEKQHSEQVFEEFDPTEVLNPDYSDSDQNANADVQMPPSSRTRKKQWIPDVKERYANLRKYLAVMRGIVQFVAILIAVGSLVIIMYGIAQSAGEVVQIATATLGGLFGFLIAYVWYIFNMAAIEFIQTVVDTEENTRRTNFMLLEVLNADSEK